MGCIQAKPSKHSPPRGLDKMKLDSGYTPSSTYSAPPHKLPPTSRTTQVAADDVGNVPAAEAATTRKAGAGWSPESDEMVGGWPRWLTQNIPSEVLAGIVPKSADSYDKLDKIGQGTYSNVYKARDRHTGKIVALKKVRFDTSEPESVKFMAREIMILQKLDHPNVMKLEGLATSRMQYSLYLVFDFMETDLSRVIGRSDARLTEPQVKCYMQQLLSGLEHCHERGILHRDIKGSNLLIDKSGMLKIADFGLANYFNPKKKRPLTSRVVTLWYRAPELLLGTTDYGVGIDLWSAGCLLAEMFAGRAIMPGRTEVEQLHRIFKLCGSPSDDYWRKLKLSTSFRPPQPYESSILETFKDFPSSFLGLLTTLLALDPSNRGSAASALQNEFFSTSPLACNLSGLPVMFKEENNEPNQHRDRRKRRKPKKRSSMHREDHRKMEEIPKQDSGSSEEEKAIELPVACSQDLGSSTGSTSSGVKPKRHSARPPEFASPAASPLREPPRKYDSQPLTMSNAKNLPSAATAYKDRRSRKEGIKNIDRRHDFEKRSSSSSTFHRYNEKPAPKQYALVDEIYARDS